MTEPVIFEYDPCKQPVFWYVVFTPTITNLMPWWARWWMRRDFYNHVYAFRDYNGITLTINQLAQGLILDASLVPAAKCVEVLAAEDRETVVLFAGQLKYRYTPRGVQSCVSVVKSLIGLKAWHIWTPQQLFNHLINNGGVVLWQAARQRSYNQASKSAKPSTCANKPNSRAESN
jgi:hypothetical protein